MLNLLPLLAGGMMPQILGQGGPPGAGAATDALIQQQMAGLQGPQQMQAPQPGPPAPPMPQPGPPSPQDDPLTRFKTTPGLMGKIGGFAGNVGQNLQNPAHLLGIAGLSEIDPRLGMAGMLAGGLFGGRRGD